MRKAVLLLALLLTAAPVHASPRPVPDPFNGCAYTAVDDGSATRGELDGFVAVADLPSEQWPSGDNPVEVTLTCSVQAPGDYRHDDPDLITTSASGTYAAVVPPTAFTAPPPTDEDGWPPACGRVDVRTASGATYTFWSNSQNGMWETGKWGTCTGAPQCLAYGPDCTWEQAVLQEYLPYVLGTDDPIDAGDLMEAGDPVICPLLVGRSPGVPGVVDIDPTGDTYVAGSFFWDCPPYRT